jgi:arogenate dehydrogenase (NADP+)
VSEVVRSLKANLFLCEPDVHDRAVAAISHVPVMVSASLISTCMAEPDPAVLELSKKLASSGFRDTSRVGGGNPELGVMMARFNRDAVLNTLHRYREQIDALVTLIEQEDWATLETRLTQTQAARPEFVPLQDV